MQPIKQIYLHEGIVIAKVIKDKRVCHEKRFIQSIHVSLLVSLQSESVQLEYLFKEAHKWCDEIIKVINKNEC